MQNQNNTFNIETIEQTFNFEDFASPISINREELRARAVWGIPRYLRVELPAFPPDYVNLAANSTGTKNIPMSEPNLETIKVQQTCSICLDNFDVDIKNISQLICTHCFHLKCITNWIEKSKSCPVCRKEFTK